MNLVSSLSFAQVKPAPLPKPHQFRKYCKEHLKKRFPKKCELDECDMCCCPPVKCKDKLGKKSLLGCKSSSNVEILAVMAVTGTLDMDLDHRVLFR
ncbi:hypothetical protein LSTR_LSTR009720 [Laodelphax striatellus]|uniref:Uncharacterized protein n=1 Tax=Laodelphax striatellus TaxID=195883 RepID=A0A482WVI6_LAOST|nr:hypothetical protein LSTR_LSTR009720 [Laodelphax striatellus]